MVHLHFRITQKSINLRKDLRDYLGALYDSILYKDVSRRHRIRFPLVLENLAKFLISSVTGSPRSFDDHQALIKRTVRQFKQIIHSCCFKTTTIRGLTSMTCGCT